MDNVELNEQLPATIKHTPRILRFILSTGIVRTEAQASYVALLIAFIFFLLTSYILFSFTSNTNTPSSIAPHSLQDELQKQP